MADKARANVPVWRQHAVTAGVAGIAAIFGLAGALIVSGREHESTQAPIISNTSADPAATNMATPGVQTAFYGTQPVAGPATARVLPASATYAPQSSGQSYPPGQQAPAPIVRGNNSQQNESLQYNTQPPADNGDPNNAAAQGANGDPNAQGVNTDPNAVDPNAPTFDNQPYADASAQENAGYDALEQAGQAAQAEQAPPPLPEYDQPPAPDDNYLWTPGYWSYSSGYYWVPGAWVAPPFYGALWTPPWWGWYRGRYFLHRGYWGPHIGYYGGINYGCGYIGTGYYGGYWQGRNFFYNRSVNNINLNRVRNVYERPVVINNVVYTGRPTNRMSFNGPNGIQARPRSFELAAIREPHYAPVQAQVQLHQAAVSNRSQFFSANHGRPAEAFHAAPLSSPANIANTPPQGINRAQGGAFGNRPAITQPVAAPGATTAGPRNEGTQQRTGQWQNGPGRDAQQGRQAIEQQRNQPLQQDQQRNQQIQQQQQRQAWEQQRNQQSGQEQQQRVLQQQQRQALDQQRSQQLQQDQGRNQQFQQERQRQAIEQQRTQELGTQQLEQQQRTQQVQQVQQEQQQRVLQQQQRQAQEQQRNLQFQQEQQQHTQQQQQQQQQRQAWEQQRNAQVQQQQQQRVQGNAAPQHIEARPAPQPPNIQARPAPQQHVEAPRPPAPQHFDGGGGRHR